MSETTRCAECGAVILIDTYVCGRCATPNVTPTEALSLAILALNTYTDPSATDQEGYDALGNWERVDIATAILASLRDYVTAQGEDLVL